MQVRMYALRAVADIVFSFDFLENSEIPLRLSVLLKSSVRHGCDNRLKDHMPRA